MIKEYSKKVNLYISTKEKNEDTTIPGIFKLRREKDHNTKVYSKTKYFSIKIEHNFKSKNLPLLQIFQKLNRSLGFNFFRNFYSSGVLKHVNNGYINKVFFPTSSKRRNIRILNKINTFIINFLINKIKKKIKKINFISNTTSRNLLEDDNFFKLGYPNRLKKKKRSLQRRSRKKIFRSKYGRVWLTN